MHMADALISPAVGGTMLAVSAGLGAYSAHRIRASGDEKKVPLMGVMGAFVFAAQMINFSIPGTGSSGHIGGGILLAALLGPYAGFLTIASVLIVQALFFADGGLLALGCNVFNMGFLPCFVAYPLVYNVIAGRAPTRGRLIAGATAGSIVGLLLGALGVVLETTASGITELPFATFVLLMLPIHLAIGVAEGLATAAVVLFVWRARPEVVESAGAQRPIGPVPLRPLLVGLGVVALATAGMLSWFASTHPDGLEWSMFRTSGREKLEARQDGVHASAARVQKTTAVLPDYGFPQKEGVAGEAPATGPAGAEPWPAVSAGTSAAGIIGAAMTLLLVLLAGLALRLRARRQTPAQGDVGGKR